MLQQAIDHLPASDPSAVGQALAKAIEHLSRMGEEFPGRLAAHTEAVKTAFQAGTDYGLVIGCVCGGVVGFVLCAALVAVFGRRRAA